MATNKTIPNPLPPAPISLTPSSRSPASLEDYSYRVMDAPDLEQPRRAWLREIKVRCGVPDLPGARRKRGPADQLPSAGQSFTGFMSAFGGKADIIKSKICALWSRIGCPIWANKSQSAPPR